MSQNSSIEAALLTCLEIPAVVDIVEGKLIVQDHIREQTVEGVVALDLQRWASLP